jgi:hypothetical protein
VIFLLNHGIIITTDNISEVYNLINDVLEKFESYQNMDFLKYKNTNKISKTINSVFKIDNVSYLCEDEVINSYLSQKIELFKESITFPDFLIYCGVKVLFGLENID